MNTAIIFICIDKDIYKHIECMTFRHWQLCSALRTPLCYASIAGKTLLLYSVNIHWNWHSQAHSWVSSCWLKLSGVQVVVVTFSPLFWVLWARPQVVVFACSLMFAKLVKWFVRCNKEGVYSKLILEWEVVVSSFRSFISATFLCKDVWQTALTFISSHYSCLHIYVANRLQTWPVCKRATGL